MAFAEGTTVAASRSQQEIADLIRKYGAGSFATGEDHDRALVTFIAHDRQVRFTLRLPTDPKVFARTATGISRNPAARQRAMEAEIRRLWRALLLVIKAKFEVIASGIATFEEEFLAQTVLPSGATVSDDLLPRIDQAITAGQMPTRLLQIEA